MKALTLFKLDFDHDRIFGLDLLRMFAVMFVVVSHSASFLPVKVHQFINFFYFDGVCIFFVLSGFLIGRILIKSIEKRGFSKAGLLNFWIRRWCRTLPNYYLFVFILGTLSKIFIVGFPLRAIIPYLYFSQNIYRSNDAFFGESWSLSIEEWFYLTIPLLVFIFIKFFKMEFRKSLLIISIFFLLFSTFLRYYMYTSGNLAEMGDYRRVVIMRIDNIMYGVIGAYISFYYAAFWLKYKYKFFIVGVILLLVWKYLSEDFPIRSFYYSNIFFPLFCLGVLCILPVLSDYKVKKHNNITKAVTYISLISYSLYLIHYSLVKKLFIDNILVDYFDDSLTSTVLKNVFYWSVSILGSILIYKYFEVPTIKLRDLFKFKDT